MSERYIWHCALFLSDMRLALGLAFFYQYIRIASISVVKALWSSLCFFPGSFSIYIPYSTVKINASIILLQKG